MTKFDKIVYKGVPVKIEVRKPRYYYKDIIVKFNESSNYTINLEPFEGIDYSVDSYFIKYDGKVLWDYSVLYDGIRCLAPVGYDYLFVNDEGEIVSCSGCLKNGKDVAFTKTYTGFAKDDNLILGGKSDEIEGYTNVGDIVVFAHTPATYYRKNYYEANSDDINYVMDEGGSIWADLGNSGLMIPSNVNVFSSIYTENVFFGYEVRLTSKIVLNDISGYRRLFMFDGLNWFGCDNGKVCIYDKLTADTALTAGVTYWIRFREVFTGNTFFRYIDYIEDDGYNFDTLPDESLWTVKSSNGASSFLNRNVTFVGVGCNEIGDKSWQGLIDLMNTRFEMLYEPSVVTLWRPMVSI